MAEQIIFEYRDNLEEFLRKLRLLGPEFRKQAESSQKSLNDLRGTITNLAGAFGIAFGTQQIASFTQEVVQLGAKSEAIERAFSRIGSPTLLNKLRQAVKGTVSDLELMRFAVEANNFKVPLDQLAQFLEFARRRAAETGKSMEYLTDSIQTAIGRGSIEVWDNLGFSISKVKEYLNGASIETLSVGERAVIMGKLTSEALGEMGADSITTAERIGAMSAEWENVKEAIGDAIIKAVEFFDVSDAGLKNQQNNQKASIDLNAKYDKAVSDTYYKIQDIIADTSDKEEQLSRMRAQRAKAEQELIEITSIAQKNKDDIALTLAQKRLDAAVGFNVIDQLAARENLANVEKEIEGHYRREQILKEIIKLYDAQISPQKAGNDLTKEQIRNIPFLEAAIKKLNEEHDAEGTSIARILEINKELIPLQAELDYLNGKSAKSAEDQAEALKKLKERLSDLTEMAVKGIASLRQYAVDEAGLNNSLNTLNESLAQARAQYMAAPIGSSVFDQAKKDVEDLEAAIKRITDGDFIDPSRGYPGVTSGIAQQAQADLKAIQDAEAEKQSMIYAGYEGAQMVADTFFSWQARQRELDLMNLERSLANGEITQKQYDAKRKQLMKQEAEDEKAARLFSAVINVATAVTTALTAGPVSGQVLAALTAALGAVQIGLIAAEPIPQFAKGVIGINGPGTETSDSIYARLSKGESVMTAEETRRHKPLLEAIRKDDLDRFIEKHYVLPRLKDAELIADDRWSTGLALNGFNDRNLLSAIDRHREGETALLRQMLAKMDNLGYRPKRGGYA